MASTIVTGPQSADTPEGPADEDVEATTDAASAADAAGEVDAADAFDWDVDGDGFERPEDRITAFFGPAHSPPNRVAMAVAAAIFAGALIAGLVAGFSGGGGAPAHATASAPPTPIALAKVVQTRHQAMVTSTARGTAALLTLGDFPAGWTGAGTAAVTHGPAWSTKLASCVHVRAAVAHATPTKVSSPVFTSDNKTAALEESVSVYPSAAKAMAEYKAITNAKTPKCIDSVGSAALRASIQSEAGSAATVGKVAITPIPRGTLPPHETGIRVNIPLTTSAGQLNISSTEVDFVKGKLFEQLNFNGNGTPFPALLEVQLISAAQQRASS